MKLREKFKRFWTMDVHNHEGFTLVELIIVIAILAILSGVAVAGYSSYIKKANMQADKTMIAEIQNILTLAGYSGAFSNGEGGYIILTMGGIENTIEAGSALDTVLKDAFGANYKTSLKLKYSDWDSSGLSDGLAGLMAYAVKNSSYMTGNRVDALLGDVEKMTGMAQNLVTSLNSGSGLGSDMTLGGLYGADVLYKTGQKYGIGEASWTIADWEAWGAKNPEAYGNLLVLAAADDIENHKEDQEYSSASNLIMEFSSYYAFAAVNPEFSKTLDAKLDELQSVEGTSAGKAWYDALEAAAVAAGYDEYRYAYDEDGELVRDENGDPVYSEQFMLDKAAFGSMMAGMGNPSDAQAELIAKDLANANLFTNGVGNDMYNSYMDAVDAIGSILGAEDLAGITVPEGGVAILFTVSANGIVVFTSLPTE